METLQLKDESELWIDVKGYEGKYQVSNKGNVRSLDREVFNKGNNTICKMKGRLLKPNIGKHGYPYVGLYDKNNLRINSLKVHRLVAFAFCGGYEEGLEVNHINGIRHDNNAENLEWVTRSGNNRHRFVLGYKIPSGEDSFTSKLKEDYIPIIFSLYDSGVSQYKIAKAFNVSQGTISNLINNKTYKKELIDKNLAINLEEI